MKIAIIGYGKMGKAIEEIAVSRGHEAVLKINTTNLNTFTPENLSRCDVAIEFTGPNSAFENISSCLHAHIPVVSGSTGWLHHWNEATSLCEKLNGTLLYASNFSVGVNLFFELNTQLATLMSKYKGYIPAITETHHTQKRDAPSGTAITLAEQIIRANHSLKGWTLFPLEKKDYLTITAIRKDPAPGSHRIIYSSDIDDILIEHTAHNRKGFATGAVLAAEYALNHKGILTMKEVLGI